MSKYTETEVKLYYPDLAGATQKLKALGAKLVTPRVFERNVRYENAEQTLSRDGIVVRLREDNRVRFTYKSSATVTNGITQRLEAEVEVSDFDTMDAIFSYLGYDPYMVYEKYRTTYKLDEAEIVLDEMPYGNFIEIEGEPKTIESLLTQLDLGAAQRYTASYSRLFDYVRHHLDLDFDNLTFANFEGITVPESAFARWE